MSAADLSNLWQNTKANQYHVNYEPRCKTGYSFGTLCHFDTALRSRYGAWSSLSQYVEEAQAQDYENTRAQFEAFIDHANNTPLPSTGTIYWQMNKGWPSLLWTLYNSDGDQAGQLLRHAGGQPAAARALRARQRHGHAGQPRRAVTVRPVGGGQGLQPGRDAARRPDRQQHHAGQPAGANKRADAEGADGQPGPGLLRRAAAEAERHARRPQRLLALHPAGRGELEQDARPAAGRALHLREPDVAADAAAVRRLRHRHHSASPGRTARTAPPRSRSPTPPRRRSRSCSAPTSGGARPAARNCPATTNCSPRSGKATTSRCSRASRRR